jgi:hypothetical protein
MLRPQGRRLDGTTFRLSTILYESNFNIAFSTQKVDARASECSSKFALVIHTVGHQARRRAEGREGIAPDSATVFHNQDPKRVSYMEVDQVERAQ